MLDAASKVLCALAVVIGTTTAGARAQAPATTCEVSWLAEGSVSARHLAVTSPAFPASRCLGVHVGSLEIAAPLAMPHASTCEVAVLHRRVITRTELCGNDVHFDPIVQVGVVILARRGDGWTRRASGMLDVEITPTARLTARDTDGDGHDELVLDGRFVLAIDRRRVRIARPVGP